MALSKQHTEGASAELGPEVMAVRRAPSAEALTRPQVPGRGSVRCRPLLSAQTGGGNLHSSRVGSNNMLCLKG